MESNALPDLSGLRYSHTLFFLFVLFGLSSWTAINGVFIELPALIEQTPEKLQIAVILVACVQAANVFPAAHVLLSRTKKYKLSEGNAILYMLGLGVVASALLATFWSETTKIDGEQYSVALYLFVFLLGVVDCMSSVLFWSFAYCFPPEYVSALATGEGGSGAAMGLLGVAQSAGMAYGERRFTVSVYFALITMVMIISAAAYAGILWQTTHSSMPDVFSEGSRLVARGPGSIQQYQSYAERSQANEEGVDTRSTMQWLKDTLGRHRQEYVVSLMLNFMSNGLVPGMTAYALCGYHDGARVLLWCTIASMLCEIGVNLLTRFVKIFALGTMTCIYFVVCLYMAYLAISYPHPPLSNAMGAGAFNAVVFVLGRAICSYTRTMVWIKIREDETTMTGRLETARVGGLVTQAGSMLGAFLALIFSVSGLLSNGACNS